MLDEDSSGAAIRRFFMPVRSKIHASDVSTIVDIWSLLRIFRANSRLCQ